MAVNRQNELPKNAKKLPKDATKKSFRRNAVLRDRSSHPTEQQPLSAASEIVMIIDELSKKLSHGVGRGRARTGSPRDGV